MNGKEVDTGWKWIGKCVDYARRKKNHGNIYGGNVKVWSDEYNGRRNYGGRKRRNEIGPGNREVEESKRKTDDPRRKVKV